MITNEHITLGSNSYEKVKTFRYVDFLLTNQNKKCRHKAGNSYHYSVRIGKLKYIKQLYCQLCCMVVKHDLLH
jgi:hypothetical protein